MARVQLFMGGARSGRETAIDALAAEQWGHSLLVVPTRHEAGERAARIVQSFDLPGAWDACAVSFEDLALRLLRDAGVFPHMLDETERRAAIARAVDRLRSGGKLDALGDAADSAGFANHMLRVVTKLKQAAVDPPAFRVAVARRERSSWLDSIVADVYEAYQEMLQRADAYDRVGVYWRAHVILGDEKPRLFDRVRCVLFDGFDDFTPSEFRVIEQLSRHVDTLVFGLACDPDAASQRDLYSVPLRTLGQLRGAFPAMEARSFPEPPPATRIEYVASHLFWRDEPQSPRSPKENLALQPCHDRMHECEWIGRMAKSLILEQGVAAETIAVAFRTLENVAPRLRVVFNEFQIPATFHAPRTLLDSSFVRFLLRVLDVGAEWEREAVLDVLTSRWSGAPETSAAAYGYLARTAGVIKGKREWMGCAQRLRAWLAEGAGEQRDRILKRMPDAVSRLDELLRQLTTLDEWLRQVPANASRAEFTSALLRLVTFLHPERAVDALQVEEHCEFEANALRGLNALLRRMDAWDRQLPDAKPISLSDFQAELREALAGVGVDDEKPRVGVQIMSAETARYRDYDYLFLGGLNEGAFPAPPATDAVYSDEDWRDLERAGARTDLRSRHMDRELLLFHHVLGRARSGALVSWCMAGPDGRPLAPSPFVGDITELMDWNTAPAPQSTSFVPGLRDAASPRDLRNANGVVRDIERALPEIFASTRAGVDVETERNGLAAFAEYDGVLSGLSLRDQLSRKYGPDYAFSAAQLESYAECPFQFYLDRILGIDAVAVPDEEFDPRTRGRILHDVLQQFHAGYRGMPARAIPLEEARDAMARLCGEVFDRHACGEVTAPRGVVRVERARMEAQLLRYMDLARDEDEPWAPSHFEVGFGRAHAGSDEALTRSEPFPLDTEDGTVLLSGRIDRIDRMGSDARIVDYKSTIRYSAKDVLDGVSLQMPLYAVALETFLMPGTECKEAKLIQPGKKDDREVLQRKGEKWPEREAAMKRGVARAVAGIREGRFPPAPHDECCRVCAGSRACRYEQWRTERKAGSDGAPHS